MKPVPQSLHRNKDQMEHRYVVLVPFDDSGPSRDEKF